MVATSEAGSGSGDGGSQAGSGSSFGGTANEKMSPNHEENATFDEAQALQTALFGVLYTVSKEKDRVPVPLVGFRLLFDVLQLWLLMVNPQYGYNINKDSLIWQIVSFVNLSDFMHMRGYSFFLGCLYIFTIMLALDIGLCVWVGQAFRSNRFDMVWPIVCLRIFSLVFFQVLDIASMTLFLMTLDCRYFSVDDGVRYTNQEFDVACWSMPHLAHAAVSIIALIAFTALAAAFQMGEMELNMLTRNYLALGHSKVEVTGFFIKFVMTCASVFIVSLKWYSVVQFVLATWMVYLYLKWEPHYYEVTNHIRIASYTLVWYCSVLLIFMAFLMGANQSDDDAVERYKKNVTYAMWAGIVPMFGLGWAASHLRLKHLCTNVLQRFRDGDVELLADDEGPCYEFGDAREVELLARCCRMQHGRKDETAVSLAERIMREGLRQLPQEPFVVILHSSFLIDVQTSYQSGYAQLQNAKKLSPGFIERFAIYSREQQHTQKAAGANPGTATDLVSYVEFQRNYRLVLKVHRDALLAIRGFWQLLVHSEVNFDGLGKAVIHIDNTVKAAEKTYRMVLQRHSSNVKMVRLYAKFLESCKEDPWGASRWYAEAERLEQQDERSKNSSMLDGLPWGNHGQLESGDGRGVVITNAEGIVQLCNAAVCDILGYGRSELKGRNVSILTPSPIKENHNKLMRWYISEGRDMKGESQENRIREQVALHKEGHLVPIRLIIMRVGGIGEDSIFMGVIEPIPAPPCVARLWVLAGSSEVISADEAFMDWTGFKVEECTGAKLESLMVPHPDVSAQLKSEKARMYAKSAEAQEAQQANRPSPRTRSYTHGGAASGGRLDTRELLRKPSMVQIAEQFRSAAQQATQQAAQLARRSSVAGAVGESVMEDDAYAGLIAGDEAAAHAAAAQEARAGRGKSRRHREARARQDYGSGNAASVLTAAALAVAATDGPGSVSPTPHDAPTASATVQVAQPVPVPVPVTLVQYPVPPTAPQAPAPASAMKSPKSLRSTGRARVMVEPRESVVADHAHFIPDVQMLHKYIGTTDVDVTITSTGSGAYAFHTLTFTKPSDSNEADASSGAAGPPHPYLAPTSSDLLFAPEFGSKPATPTKPFTRGLLTSGPDQYLALQQGPLDPHPPPPPTAQSVTTLAVGQQMDEMHMLVVDRKGRVLHATQGLAARLGTTKKALIANGSPNAVEAVLPQPFAQIHRQLISRPLPLLSPPPYGCRSHLAVPLLAKSPGGPELVPFRMSIEKREVGALSEAVHVIDLQEVSMQQALAERRLVMRVDGFGCITAVPTSRGAATPKRLLGVDPAAMIGHSLADYIDVFRPGTPGSSNSGTTNDASGDEIKRHTKQLLLQLVKRSVELPGCSYRVGVVSASAAQDMAKEEEETGALAGALDGSTVRPAIMTVRLTKISSPPGTDVTTATVKPRGRGRQLVATYNDMHESTNNLSIEVELWRADLVTSVIELDPSGCVTNNRRYPLYPPGLVFGSSEASMYGQSIASYLPLKGRSFKCLFQAAPEPAHRGAPSEPGAKFASAMRRQMTTSMGGGEGPSSAGPVHTMRMQHMADRGELDVAVQIVRGTAGGSYYLVAHVLNAHSSNSSLSELLLQGKASPQLPDTEIGPIKQDAYGRWRPVAAASEPPLARRSSARLPGLSSNSAPAGPHGPSPTPPQPFAALASMPMPQLIRLSSSDGSVLAPNAAGAASQRKVVSNLASSARLDSIGEVPEAAAGDVVDEEEGGAHVSDSDNGGGGGGDSVDGSPRVSGVAQWLADSGFQPGSSHGLTGSIKGADEGPGVIAAINYQSRGGLSSQMTQAQLTSSGNGRGMNGHVKLEAAPGVARISDSGAEGPETDEEAALPASPMPHQAIKVYETAAEHASDVAEEAGAPGSQVDGYKRENRFKKLYRMIGSPQASRSVSSFRIQMFVMVAVLLAVHCGCFAVMELLMSNQSSRVSILNKGGLSARYAGEIAVYVNCLRMIFENRTYPWLPHLTSYQDLPFMLKTLDDSIDLFNQLHYQVYLELGSSSMTEEFGLRQLWNFPTINVTMYYDVLKDETSDPTAVLNQPVKRTELKSLFDAGTYLGAQARDLHDHGALYVNGLNHSLAASRQYLFINDNALSSVITPYLSFLDIMVQLVVQDANNANTTQIMILALEGAVLTTLVMIYTWTLATHVNKLRRLVYGVFVSLPQSLVRSLATKRLNLDDEDDEDDDVADPAVKQALDTAPGVLTEKQLKEASRRTTDKRAPSTTSRGITFGLIPGQGDEGGGDKQQLHGGSSSVMDTEGPAGAPPTLSKRVSAVFIRLGAYIRSRRRGSGAEDSKSERKQKRRLKGSVITNIKFTWPLLLWGLLVIVMNGTGYGMLSTVSSPIATFNLVNFVMVRMQRNIFFVMSIAFSDNPDAVKTFRDAIASSPFEREYRAALFGSAILPNETSPHFTLAKTGITQAGGQGTYILYDDNDCLCLDQRDCHTDPSSVYYTLTHGGLNGMVEEFIHVKNTIIQMTGLDPDLGGPEFAFVWNVQLDITGGFELLNEAYHQHVQQVYSQVANLHTALFALTCLVLLGFVLGILRPFLANATSEKRRIAELLSQLPAEVDMEGKLQKALLKATNNNAAGVGGMPLTGLASSGGGGLKNQRHAQDTYQSSPMRQSMAKSGGRSSFKGGEPAMGAFKGV